MSHIVSGYWYNSAANLAVRIDETYQGAYGSSLFDYSDMTADGLVKNYQTTIGPSVGSNASCFNDYVALPGFPLITPEFLQNANATFGGVVDDDLMGTVQTVRGDSLFQSMTCSSSLTSLDERSGTFSSLIPSLPLFISTQRTCCKDMISGARIDGRKS